MDIPLNATGLAQARVAAEALRGRGLVRVICSPLGRARVTAEIAAAAIGLTVEIDEGLREAAFGVQEGQATGPWFAAWVAGGPAPVGGESFAELRRRAVAAVNRALAGPRPVLVVAHGALFRALRAAMGLPIDVRMPNATPVLCTPPESGSAPWSITPAAEIPLPAAPLPEAG